MGDIRYPQLLDHRSTYSKKTWTTIKDTTCYIKSCIETGNLFA